MWSAFCEWEEEYDWWKIEMNSIFLKKIFKLNGTHVHACQRPRVEHELDCWSWTQSLDLDWLMESWRALCAVPVCMICTCAHPCPFRGPDQLRCLLYRLVLGIDFGVESRGQGVGPPRIRNANTISFISYNTLLNTVATCIEWRKLTCIFFRSICYG